MARRGYGAEMLPSHYRRRSRRGRRRLPPLAGHSIVRGHYRHNPKGGTNWMPIILIGAGAFLLLPMLTRGGGLGGIFPGMGTSVMPPGYQYMGSGYYRGPDGSTYFRNPTTGQMAPVGPGQAITGQVTQAGMNVLTGILPTVTTGITSFFKGLFTPAAGGALTEQAPIGAGTVEGDVLGTGAWSGGFSDVLRSDGYNGGGAAWGVEPTPLPDFQSI